MKWREKVGLAKGRVKYTLSSHCVKNKAFQEVGKLAKIQIQVEVYITEEDPANEDMNIVPIRIGHIAETQGIKLAIAGTADGM